MERRMKVYLDLDPRDVWRLQDQAEKRGITPGEVLRDELAHRRNHLEFHNRVRARVLAGMSDREIADEMSVGVTSIRDVRQVYLKLPANRKYR